MFSIQYSAMYGYLTVDIMQIFWSYYISSPLTSALEVLLIGSDLLHWSSATYVWTSSRNIWMRVKLCQGQLGCRMELCKEFRRRESNLRKNLKESHIDK